MGAAEVCLFREVAQNIKEGISFGTECKMEFRCRHMKIKEVLEAIKSIHPYEEPIINIISLLNE